MTDLDHEKLASLVVLIDQWTRVNLHGATRECVYAYIGNALVLMALNQYTQQIKDKIDGPDTPRHTQQ